MRPNRRIYQYLLILSLFSLLLVVSCSSSTTSQTGEITTYEVPVDLPGRSSVIIVNGFGNLLKNAQITSLDGSIALSLNKDTTLLDSNQKPLQSIKVVIDPTVPVPPQDAEVVSQVFDIQPADAVISPWFKLTLGYDPSLLPQGVSENDVWVYGYREGSWETVRYKQVDTKSNRITTTVDRFGKYSVLAQTKPVEPQKPPPGLTSITLKQALSNGKPTLAEFGRGTCIPCKEMKPILENLGVEYQDRLNVSIVSVDEYGSLTNYYRVMAIPTQIGFDSTGKEVFRHVGFWPKDQIVAQLSKLGIK